MKNKYQKIVYYVIFSIGLISIIGCKTKNTVKTEPINSSPVQQNLPLQDSAESSKNHQFDEKRLYVFSWLRRLNPSENPTTIADQVLNYSDTEINTLIQKINTMVAYNYTLLDTFNIVRFDHLNDPCTEFRELLQRSLNVHLTKNPKDFGEIYKETAKSLLMYHIADLKKNGITISDEESKQQFEKISHYQDSDKNCDLIYDGFDYVLKKLKGEGSLDKVKIPILQESLRIAMGYMDFFSSYNNKLFISHLLEKNHSEEKKESTTVIPLPFTVEDVSIGYIKIQRFEEGMSNVVAQAVSQFPSTIAGIIIDLRDNRGGSVDEMLKLVHYFVKDAYVYRILKQSSRLNGKENTNSYITEALTRDEDTPKTPLFGGPLAILINEGTASAAELFTQAMKDYGRALILGKRSFGKGIGQFVMRLQENTNFGGEIAVTNSIFFFVNNKTDSRRSFPQIEGVSPHIIVSDGNKEVEKHMKDFPNIIDPTLFISIAKNYTNADKNFIPFNTQLGSVINQLKSPDTSSLASKEQQLEVSKKIMYDFIKLTASKNK